MANQIEGVRERLLECATREFLEKGYAEASLRVIANEAQTNTSAIYVRFGDKAGMFSAIIDDACDSFLKCYQENIDLFNETNGSRPVPEMIDYKLEKTKRLLDVIYTHYDAFKLLVSKAESGMFSDFLYKIAELECKQTVIYIENIHSDAIASGRLSNDLMYTLSTAYWSGVFEIVSRDMSEEAAQDYLAWLRRFFICGWTDILLPKKEQ